MSDGKDKVAPLRKPVACPNCGKPSSRDTYPFCSTRCSDVDLNRWFSGSYAVPAEPADDSSSGAEN
ncbi:DNA gyrase inhibitor YacG [Salaquimonas pukyongi]|uniref:DNA gyrase inhibitor YacG n=1 Tax=Salaquimonas pukyongi TaxID=2712698 RepID=UPI00096BA82A|nr:DNA gyrase inhibitor YacG [Salaquimonas pukyongi]